MLHRILRSDYELIPQNIEPDFAHRSVHNVATVGIAARITVHFFADARHRHTEEFNQRTHPLGVTMSQVIVDCDAVDALAPQSEAGSRHRPHQSLALTSGHVDHIALEKSQRSLQLYVERHHAKPSL